MIAIVACSSNWIIGAGGKIPWKVSEDMQFFKETTSGHILLMGRRTFESLGSKPLNNRINYVLTKQNIQSNLPNLRFINNINEIRYTLKDEDRNKKIFLCGGAELYEQYLPYCYEMLLTMINIEVEGDVTMPRFIPPFKQDSIIMENEKMKVMRFINVETPISPI